MPQHQFTITKNFVNYRLDKFLQFNFPQKTRNYLQKLIKENFVLINSKPNDKNGTKLKINDQIKIIFPAPKIIDIKAQNIPLDIIYEDKNLLIINKAAGIVVHPSSPNQHDQKSIVNAVLYHCPNELSGISGELRPGIVHRLDKDTSGLLMIAKNDQTHQYLSQIIKSRQIKKEYLALVKGTFSNKKGRIEAPIGRSIQDRKKMAVIRNKNHRLAITEFTVLKNYHNLSLLKINLITGRTHQIRVHLASIGHQVVGDNTYGDSKLNQIFKKEYGLTRQFLHAQKLSFKLLHAKTSSTFSAPLPPSLEIILSRLDK
jgi:23S rRNA pseudouridine1911/1915/1917 synthase